LIRWDYSKIGGKIMVILSSLNFSGLLVQYRKREGLKQKDLAKKLGWRSSSFLSMIEKEQRVPTREVVLKIVAGLGLSSRQAKDLFLMAAGHAPCEETISEIIFNGGRTVEEEAEWQERWASGKFDTLIIEAQEIHLW
jgi:transcriptional regulator with XRE-family HTH domain